MIKQISVFLENKSGKLISITRILGQNGINIKGLCIADTSDFGILRLIVDKPDEAYNALKENNITATITDVIAMEVPDMPGGLAGVLSFLEKEDINIQYLYSFIEKPSDNAIIMMRVEEVKKTIDVLKKNGVPLVPEERIYKA